MDVKPHNDALSDVLEPRTQFQIDQPIDPIVAGWEFEYYKAWWIFFRHTGPNPDMEECYEILADLRERRNGEEHPPGYRVWTNHLAMRCLLLGVMSLLRGAEVKGRYTLEDGEEALWMLNKARAFSEDIWEKNRHKNRRQPPLPQEQFDAIDEFISQKIEYCKKAFNMERKKRESKERRFLPWNKLKSISKGHVMGSSKKKGYSRLVEEGN
ncbi:MAG: hypothetical protein Q9223_007804 [Gallowayella weberi]